MNKFYQIAVSVLTVFSVGAVQAEIAPPHPIGKIYPEPHYVLSEYQEAAVTPDKVKVIWHGGEMPEVCKLGEKFYRDAVSALKHGEDAVALEIHAGLLANAEIQKLYNYDMPLLPTQGYALKLLENSPEKMSVVITGTDEKGVLFGFCSLAQLLYEKDGETIQKIAEVEDYPVWRHRFISDYLANQSEDGYLFALQFKVGSTASILQNNWTKPEWWEQNKHVFEAIKKLSDMGAMEFMALPHIYSKPATNKQFNIADPADLKMLADACRKMAESGYTYIMIGADDLTPYDINEGFYAYNQEEMDMFHNSIGEAHGYMMKYLYDTLIPDFPNLKLSMVGAPYAFSHGVGRPMVDKYIRDWGKAAPKEVMWVWTGRGVFSPEIQGYEIERLQNLLNGQEIFLFDNSNGFYSPLPRWETRFYPGMERDNADMIYLNGCFYRNGCRNYEALRFLSTCDYLWNPEAYNAERSYNTALAMVFDPSFVKPINNLRSILTVFDDVEYTGFRDQLKDLSVEQYQAALDEVAKMNTLNGKPFNVGYAFGLDRIQARIERAKSLLAAELPKAEIKKQTSAVVLDGVLAPGEWDDATILLLKNADGSEDNAPTKVYMSYTDDGVYMAFDVPAKTPLPENPRTKFDDAVFANPDCVEIMLQVLPDTQENIGSYAHYCFDFAGNMFDEAACNGNVFWNGDWKVRTAPTETGWSAEVFIRPTATNFTRYATQMEDKMYNTEKHPGVTPPAPAAGQQWKVNVHRIENSSGKVQSWGRGGFKFHLPSYFGTVELK